MVHRRGGLNSYFGLVYIKNKKVPSQQRAHYSKNEDRPEVAELIKLIIKCMDEKDKDTL